jgi:hypothetical protein
VAIRPPLQHAGVDRADRTALVVHAFEVAVQEPLGVGCARQGEHRHLGPHLTDLQLDAGPHVSPRQAADGDVLTGAARRDRMAFGGELVDHVGRPDAQGLPRPAVVAPHGLAIADDAHDVDLDHVDRPLRHAAVGRVELLDRAVDRRRQPPAARRAPAASWRLASAISRTAGSGSCWAAGRAGHGDDRVGGRHLDAETPLISSIKRRAMGHARRRHGRR